MLLPQNIMITMAFFTFFKKGVAIISLPLF